MKVIYRRLKNFYFCLSFPRLDGSSFLCDLREKKDKEMKKEKVFEKLI